MFYKFIKRYEDPQIGSIPTILVHDVIASRVMEDFL